MGRVLMPGSSGGGGSDTSIVTASAADVVKGKVIVGPNGEPITGTLELSGNAGTGDVLANKTFYNNGFTKQTGTMINQGAKTASLQCGASYIIPAGYHNGQGTITANSLASQTSATATAGDIKYGKTAYVNGNKITGESMKMYGRSQLFGLDGMFSFMNETFELEYHENHPEIDTNILTLTFDWVLEGENYGTWTSNSFSYNKTLQIGNKYTSAIWFVDDVKFKIDLYLMFDTSKTLWLKVKNHSGNIIPFSETWYISILNGYLYY